MVQLLTLAPSQLSPYAQHRAGINTGAGTGDTEQSTSNARQICVRTERFLSLLLDHVEGSLNRTKEYYPHFNAQQRDEQLLELIHDPLVDLDVTIPFDAPEPLLPYLVRRKCYDLALTIIPRANLLEERDKRGFTAMHYAAEQGHTRIIEALHNRGVSLERQLPAMDAKSKVTIKSLAESRPLHLAARNGHMHTVQWLLNHGAERDAPRLRTQHSDDDTVYAIFPVQEAARAGHIDVVEAFLNHGTPATIIGHDGRSLLHEALDVKKYATSLVLAKRLLERAPELVHRRNIRTDTFPIKIAARKNHAAMIRLLLSHGADPNSFGDDFLSETPLIDAVFGDSSKNKTKKASVEALLEGGANPNTPILGGAPGTPIKPYSPLTLILWDLYSSNLKYNIKSFVLEDLIHAGAKCYPTDACGAKVEDQPGKYKSLNELMLVNHVEEIRRQIFTELAHITPKDVTPQTCLHAYAVGEQDRVLHPDFWKGKEQQALAIMDQLPQWIQPELSKHRMALMAKRPKSHPLSWPLASGWCEKIAAERKEPATHVHV